VHEFGIVVPIRNPGKVWDAWLSALGRQTAQATRVVVVDSSDDDEAARSASSAGCDVLQIAPASYDHGGARQLGVRRLGGVEFVVLMTQDALLDSPDALELLVCLLADSPSVGAAFGRQLPRTAAGAIETHARLFSYRSESGVMSGADLESVGLRAAFMSDAFCAYRLRALDQVGGFPSPIIFGEDTVVAARLLARGWDIAYCAEARVRHSHAQSVSQEFGRYFDIGAMHSMQAEIGSLAGSGSEGLKFVVSEMRHLLGHAPCLVPEALLRTASKLAAYRAGRMYKVLPPRLLTALSGNPAFWLRRVREK
jgi:rhamnosyltransferase